MCLYEGVSLCDTKDSTKLAVLLLKEVFSRKLLPFAEVVRGDMYFNALACAYFAFAVVFPEGLL